MSPLWSFEGAPLCGARQFSAVIAAGVHLFPFRTEKLSPLAPMVLGGQPPGRVGHRRIDLRPGAVASGLFFGPRRRATSRASRDPAREVFARARGSAGA